MRRRICICAWHAWKTSLSASWFNRYITSHAPSPLVATQGTSNARFVLCTNASHSFGRRVFFNTQSYLSPFNPELSLSRPPRSLLKNTHVKTSCFCPPLSLPCSQPPAPRPPTLDMSERKSKWRLAYVYHSYRGQHHSADIPPCTRHVSTLSCLLVRFLAMFTVLVARAPSTRTSLMRACEAATAPPPTWLMTRA